MKPADEPAGRRNIAVLLGVMLFFGSAYFYQDPEWNGNSRLNLTRAIVEQGTFQIDGYHEAPGWATGDKAFYGGHYYSDKAIGASLMAVPVYFLMYNIGAAFDLFADAQLVKHVLTTSVMGLMFTLAGISMYAIASRIARGAWMAILVTVFVAFGTMLWPYSALFYGHLPAAAFLALTLALLMAAAVQQDRGSRQQWFWIGLAAGIAFISDFTTAPVILGLAAYGVYALKGLTLRQRVAAAWPSLLGALIPWGAFIFYNLLVYGSPLEFGYSYEVEERFQEIMGLGLMGMRLPTVSAAYHISLDPKFGLLWQSPVLLLSAVGYWVAFREGRNMAEVLTSICAIAIVFSMNAASFLWYGGSAFGPRLLIAALPFFVVPLAMIPSRATWLLSALGLLSVANMLIPLLGKIQFTLLEFDPRRGGFQVERRVFTGFSLLYGYGWTEAVRLHRIGQSPWTLGAALGLPLSANIAALLAILSGLMLRLRRLAIAS